MDDFDQLIHLATEHYKSLRLGDAVEAYRAAIALRPDVAAVHSNLGSALRLLGRLDEAIASFNEALRLQPNAFQTWSNLGNLCKITGDLDAAIAAYRRAIAINPDNAESHNNLGATLEDTGDMPAAIASYRRAAELQPESAAIGSNLVYAMHFSSDYTAEEILAAHIAWNDRHAAALLPPLPSGERTGVRGETPADENHSSADPRQSVADQSRSPDERHPTANVSPLTPALSPPGRGSLRRLKIGYVSPDFRDHVIGRFMRPILANHDRSAVEIFCYSDVLRPDAVTKELRSNAEHWRVILGLPDEMVADRIRADGIDVLVDLTMHMARNRLAVFARKPAAVQVTYLAYCSTTGLDAMDFRLTDRWLDPPVANAQERNRQSPPLDVRPHLTSPGGRGAGDAADWEQPSSRPSDNLLLPPDFGELSRAGEGGDEGELKVAHLGDRLPPAIPKGLPYTERSIYLPETYWCYDPPTDAPEVSPTPAIANGFFTFGCLNNFCKVSPAALATWAEILKSVPESRLILHAKEGSHRERIRKQLIEMGVDLSSARTGNDFWAGHLSSKSREARSGERLLFVPMLPLRDYLALYSQIDLALDPFPYGGGTTTLDALWMGVPVVTLAGETAVGRGGVSILMNLGLETLVARSKTSYSGLAVELVSKLESLDTLRSGMRERMRGSLLMDAKRFVRNLEGAYRSVAG